MKNTSILLKIAFTFTMVACALGYFGLYTTAGLQSIYKITKSSLPGNLKINALSGTIRYGIAFKNMDYSSEDITISISNFTSKWGLDFFRTKLTLESITADEVAMLLPQKTQDQETTPFNYPWWLHLDIKQFQIKYFMLKQLDFPPILIKKINVSAEISKFDFIIRNINANYDGYKIQSTGLVKLYEDFKISLTLDANNDTTHQSYSSKITGTYNNITGFITASPNNSIDLKFDVDIQDSILNLKANWLDGNLLYEDTNFSIRKGEVDISTEIKLPSNRTYYALDYLTKSISKTQSIDTGIILSNIIMTAKYGSYSASTKTNAEITKNILNIDGTLSVTDTVDLNSMDLKAKYDINASNNMILFKNLIISDNKNILSASGELSEKSDFKYNVIIDDLSKYSSLLGGEISSSGTILGEPSSPQIKFTIEANKIVFPDIENEYLKLNFEVNRDFLKSKGQLDIVNCNFKGTSIDKLTASLGNKGSKQFLSMFVDASKYKVDIALGHTLSEKKHALTVNRLKIIDPIQDVWNMKNPTKITMENDKLDMSDLCLLNSSNKICVNFKYANKKNFSAKANIKANTNLINYYISPIEIDTLIAIDFDFIAKNNRIIKADFNLLSEKILFSNKKIGSKPTIKKISIQTVSTDNNINLQAEIVSNDNNLLDLNLDYKNTSLDKYSLSKASISGILKAQYNEYKIIDSLTTTIDDIKGKLHAEISLSGTVKNPILDGALNINDGYLTISPTSTSISNIKTSLKINNNSFKFSTNANSGKGNINIIGSAMLKNNNLENLLVTLNAANFRIFDTSKITLDMNSSLKLSKNNFIILQGDIHIINGDIVIDTFPDVEFLSKDIVINQSQQSEKSPFFYDINVNINEKISLLAYNISGHLAGKLRLVNNTIFSDAVFGSIEIKKGKYKFFSNSLTIEKGRLSYAGSRIDEPRIDLRATTKIANPHLIEENIPKSVGIEAAGKIYDPEITLFANPSSFAEVDILSYLALGKSRRQISDNKFSALTSTLILLQGTNNDLGAQDKLKKAIYIDQIDINTEYSNIPETADDLRDKSQVTERTNVVLKKQITPRIDVSVNFSRGSAELQQIVKATYALTKRWQVSVERKIELDSAVRLLYNIEFW